MAPFLKNTQSGPAAGIHYRNGGQILLQNEYLATENRILRAHLPTRLRLTDPQRSTLAEIGKRLGHRALRQMACVAKPDTILAWYRKLIAHKFDGSRYRRYPGRPVVRREVIELILRMARENTAWGYAALPEH
jgi:putative transposase